MTDWIGVVGSLLGTVVGGGIGWGSATLVASSIARRQAGASLRAAFAPELARLRSTPHADWDDIGAILREKPYLPDLLGSAFMRHSVAVEEFRFHLPAGRRTAYDDAWRTYYEEEGGVGGVGFARGQRADWRREKVCGGHHARPRYATAACWPQ